MLRHEENDKILMTEGDYGLSLPIKINGISVANEEKLNLYIKKIKDGDTIVEQTYDNIKDNTFNLVFSKEQSDKLPVGRYKYALDWYKDNEFYCNIIKGKEFIVEDKI